MRPGLGTVGPHVFVDALDGDVLTLGGDAAHHLAQVLRVRVGDPVSLADGRGGVAQASVVEVPGAPAGRGHDRTAGRVGVRIDRRWQVAAAAPAVCVVQALPKARKMEEVVQRLTELGVDRIRPVVTARTVTQVAGKADKLLARWRAVALAAARQSRPARLPRIDPVATWPPDGAVGAVLWEDAEVGLAEALTDLLAAPPPELTLAIGPEGGFAEQEITAALQEAEGTGGLVPAALGHTILRTETAGVVAASVLLHRLGRLG